MKMMDINGQDDCLIEVVTPSKKKKMKQAQLPFQTRSPMQSPNVLQNKKRKLTSPSVESKSSKVVKILKKELSKDIADSKMNDSTIDTVMEKNECGEVIVVETENLKENTTSNKMENTSKSKTPKRTSIGQKKMKMDKVKSSPLAKFLKMSDKEIDGSKEDQLNSLQKEKEDEKTDEIMSQSTSNLDSKADDSFSIVDNSLCYNSDSDIAISSDNEDKEELSKSNDNLEESMSADSSKTSRTPKMDRTKLKKVTPKQQEKKLRSAQKKEERKRLKMEKEQKLEEERENRRREKEEKLKEKKMKELKKQMEIEQRQKEKQAKEEERKKKEEAREEEKRKKEEEKLEAERKKQKAASNFTSFFVAKKQGKSVDEESITKIKNFMPFEVKADMKVAPVCRRTLNEQEKLSLVEKCSEGDTRKSDLYLSEIKDKRLVPRKSSKTWPLETKDDVILIDDENDGSSNIVDQNVAVEKQRSKLLQFSENRRPPYWGTWRKRSSSIKPRMPFTKDTKWFNYEVNSDDEWEEEEPGESLRGSDDEKDEENLEDNEYDVDNEFMVPHGYLSDEELRADEEDKDMSPETQKFKLKVLGEQFESDRNTKTSKLKPTIIGCVWRGPENTFLGNVPQKTIDFLTAHEAWVRQIPVTLPTSSENEAAATTECGTPTHQHTPSSSKMVQVPIEALPDLIRLIHGNTHGRRFLGKEFMTYWKKKNNVENQVSMANWLRKIREIAKWMPCPEEGPMHLKACWYVSEEIRKDYVDEDLPLPNRWSYTLVPTRKSDITVAAEKLEKEEKDKEKKNVSLITQFTTKITQEEMKKQLKAKPRQSTPHSKSDQAKIPKRATLISVSRGEQFSKASKDSLLNILVSNKEAVNQDSRKNDGERMDDNVIVLGDDDEREEGGDKSDGNGGEDRLGASPLECEGEIKKEKKSSTNTKQNKKSTPKSKVHKKGAKGSVDTPMDIHIDDPVTED